MGRVIRGCDEKGYSESVMRGNDEAFGHVHDDLYGLITIEGSDESDDEGR